MMAPIRIPQRTSWLTWKSTTDGGKEMRMTIGMTAFGFACALSVCGELQALSLENMATVVQVNSCQDCGGVEQQTLAFIFQEISTHDVFMYTPDHMKSNKAFMQKIANLASIIQENSCIECANVDQQNFITIFQEIDVDNFSVNPKWCIR
jgi:hypothetical protein